ncbi:MAG: hypothetical protein QOF86_1935, partial [Baekduia sp.]|nr:hypothetical protein [Baekduia sp.]
TTAQDLAAVLAGTAAATIEGDPEAAGTLLGWLRQAQRERP